MELTSSASIDNFVSPGYCRELQLAGLTDLTRFYYKVLEKVAVLWTYEFDPDNYYLNGDRAISYWNSARKLPAYTIKDLEKCLPNFCIGKQDDLYTLSIDSAYGVRQLTNRRLEDVIAMGILELIRNRRIPADHFNKIISASFSTV